MRLCCLRRRLCCLRGRLACGACASALLACEALPLRLPAPPRARPWQRLLPIARLCCEETVDILHVCSPNPLAGALAFLVAQLLVVAGEIASTEMLLLAVMIAPTLQPPYQIPDRLLVHRTVEPARTWPMISGHTDTHESVGAPLRAMGTKRQLPHCA